VLADGSQDWAEMLLHYLAGPSGRVPTEINDHQPGEEAD